MEAWKRYCGHFERKTLLIYCIIPLQHPNIRSPQPTMPMNIIHAMNPSKTNIPTASKTGSKPLLSLKCGKQMDERPPKGHSWLLVRLLSAPHHARLCWALARLQFLLLSSDAILSLWELNNSWAWRHTACFGSFGSSCEWNTAERKPGQAACCPFTHRKVRMNAGDFRDGF